MHREVLLPDVDAFGELLEYIGEWDAQTMTGRGGEIPAARPAPRRIGKNEIGPYASFERNTLPAYAGPARRSMAVRATDLVLATVAPRIVTPDDHLSFRLIGWPEGRVLVLLEHGYIIGNHWLALIRPDTLPAYPFAARDTAIADVCSRITAATDWPPYRRDLPDGVREYGYNAVKRDGRVTRPPRPVMIARIAPDGTVTPLNDLPDA